MRQYYNALPVVPKIFYKQNVQDNAKGADSVHIVVLPGNDFQLWLGEAKFYNSIEDNRLNEIISSVEKSLQPDTLKKENTIITSVSDLKDCLEGKDALYTKIEKSLSSRTSIDLIKPKLHIPILLLHECEITKTQTTMSTQYKNDMLKYHTGRAVSYFSKQINKLSNTPGYGDIHFHIILFPVPDKKAIVDAFLRSVAHFKN